MTAVSYHETVNDLHALGLAGKGPFARATWFQLLEQAGHLPFVATISDSRGAIALPLTQAGGGLDVLTNWYAFTWTPLATPDAPDSLLDNLAHALREKGRLHFSKLPLADAGALERAFRNSGWRVRREACDTNHYLDVQGRSFADYLATRPGPLRTTLKRKAKKVEVRLTNTFDAADWAAYEEIYQASWKPEEGDPAMLRAFAQAESAAGHFRFALALADGVPVAAQFWTVEQGTAYIHKLAHLPSAEPLSPGTTLTAALMEQVMDRDKVAHVDFGTGNDRYKADWMEQVRARYALTCLRPGNPRHWGELARWTMRKLVSRKATG